MVYVLSSGEIIADSDSRAKKRRRAKSKIRTVKNRPIRTIQSFKSEKIHTIQSFESEKKNPPSMFWANSIGGFLLRSIVLSVVLSTVIPMLTILTGCDPMVLTICFLIWMFMG